jgi:hypothetical protein
MTIQRADHDTIVAIYLLALHYHDLHALLN